MVRTHELRLLTPLAVSLLLAATLTLPAVSHGSVVDQYTEIVPTPGGGKPAQPPSPFGSDDGPSVPAQGTTPAVVEDVVVEDAGISPGGERSGRENAPGGVVGRPSVGLSATAVPPAPGASEGMGPLFPALLLLGLVASASLVFGRRHEARGMDR